MKEVSDRIKNQAGTCGIVCGSFAQRLEVFAHDAYSIFGPHLLELFAWRPSVAGQVVNGANGIVTLASSLEGKMGAPFSSGLEDHGLRVTGIDASVCQNGRRVDDKNIQMNAALAAAQAEHDTAYGRKAYCSLRELALFSIQAEGVASTVASGMKAEINYISQRENSHM
jgi:hypothetical protein